jgi:serine/threonine protein kinase
VLIDKRGYLKLTDFGLSRFKLCEKDVSVCGTPEYLAPEIILKAGHSKEVDWWCLGCLIYEMVIGIPPFSGKNRNDLFSKIIEE